MTEIIMGQVRFVLFSACLGMFLMAGYDILRLFRFLFRHGKIAVWAEDLLFWCLMSVPAYAVFFLYNDGAIRWYGVLAIFLGSILYEYGLSRPVRAFGARHIKPPAGKFRKKCTKIIKKYCKKRANSI